MVQHLLCMLEDPGAVPGISRKTVKEQRMENSAWRATAQQDNYSPLRLRLDLVLKQLFLCILEC